MHTYTLLNDEDQRHIVCNTTKLNMFVEAGAGAGKTTCIVNRIVNQLKNGFEPEDIYVITFTDAATEELRSRIKSKLDEIPSLKGKLDNLYKMNISTIHGLCNKILSENALSARISIGAKLMDEDELEKYKNDVFKDWKKAHSIDYETLGLEKTAADKFLKSSYDNLCGQTEIKGIGYEKTGIDYATTMQRINNFSYELIPLVDQEIDNCIAETACLSYDDAIKSNDFNKLKTALIDKNDKEIVSKFKDIRDKSTNGKVEILKKGAFKKPLDLIFNKYKKIIDDIILNTLSKYPDLQSSTFTSLKELQYNSYCKLLEISYEIYMVYKNSISSNILTNDRLLTLTRDLLRNVKEKDRIKIGSKIKTLYVDEFQDTDSIQKEIIWNLTYDENKTKLRDGSLFVVGDPKQSIYRFRGAEPEVFFEAKKEMENMGPNTEIFTLSVNHRSNPKLLDYFDKTFSGKDGPFDSKNGYVKMEPREAYKTDKMDPDELAGVYRANYSSEMIPNLIKQIVKEKHQVYEAEVIKDDKGNKIGERLIHRDIQYGDFLVLFAKHKGLQKYISLFEKAGIKFNVNGEMYFYLEKALNVYSRILAYLCSKNDQYAKIGAIEALRSTIDYNKFESEKQIEIHCNSILEELGHKTEKMSAYGKSMYLCDHIEYILNADEEYTESRLFDIKTKIYQTMENVVSSGFVGDREFAEKVNEYINEIVRKELQIERTLDNGKDDKRKDPNCVRIMNMHTAKGLEGKFVIYGNLDLDRKFSFENYKKNGCLYPGFKTGSKTGWNGYEFNESLKNESKDQYDAELLRLEYVTLTRAGQAFIFMNDIIGRQDYLFEREGFDYLSNLEELPVNIEDKKDDSKNEENTIENETNHLNIADDISVEMIDALSKRSIIDQSPSGLENATSKTREEGRKKAIEENSLKENDERPKGDVFGTILHRVFELLVRYGDEKDLIINLALSENLDDGDEKVKCKKYLEKIYPLMRDFIQGLKGELKPEMKFGYFVEKDNKFIHGSIDLLVLEENKATIIDYKSDYAPYLLDDDMKKSLGEKYAPQLKEYKKAVEILYPSIKEIKCKVVYITDDSTSTQIKIYNMKSIDQYD